MEIKANKIYKEYGASAVLKDISFSLGKGQKAGLIGYNGTGKTTLLKILAGLVKPDIGEVVIRKGAVVGYMPQDTSIISDETIRNYVRRVSGTASLEEGLETSPKIMTEYKRMDGYTFYHRLDVMLAGFGLVDVSNDRPINSLSSGQKSKIFMIGVLLSSPDILLLDEPTNNLDLPTLIWLEDFLMHSDSACIIVSHDRIFLDRIVQKIFDIDWNTRTLNITSGKYSDFLLRKEKDIARNLREYKAQEKEIKRLKEIARKKKQEAITGSHYIGTDNDKSLRGFKREKAHKSDKRAKAIERRAEKMSVLDSPVERDVFHINLQPEKISGTQDITMTNVVAGYVSGGFKIGPVSLYISYGSRVAILGLNGSGKTTLLQTLCGELRPLDGNVRHGKAVVIGNLMQEHDNLPRKDTIKDFITRRAGISIQDTYALVAKSGFIAEEIDKKIADLSPGSRARLLFALFSALSANVLILDEPTNHLDLEILGALEETIENYKGTIVLASHDRFFLKKFCPTDTYVLSGGKLSRQESLESYITEAEQQARNLISEI